MTARIPGLSNATIVKAVKLARREVERSGILDPTLKLQSNTISAVFHNSICKNLEKLSTSWENRSNRYVFPDLINNGDKLDVKTSQTKKNLTGNKSFQGTNFYIVGVNYSVVNQNIKVRLIRVGFLKNTDWIKGKGKSVQFSKLSEKALMRKLTVIYP